MNTWVNKWRIAPWTLEWDLNKGISHWPMLLDCLPTFWFLFVCEQLKPPLIEIRMRTYKGHVHTYISDIRMTCGTIEFFPYSISIMWTKKCCSRLFACYFVFVLMNDWSATWFTCLLRSYNSLAFHIFPTHIVYTTHKFTNQIDK